MSKLKSERCRTSPEASHSFLCWRLLAVCRPRLQNHQRERGNVAASDARFIVHWNIHSRRRASKRNIRGTSLRILSCSHGPWWLVMMAIWWRWFLWCFLGGWRLDCWVPSHLFRSRSWQGQENLSYGRRKAGPNGSNFRPPISWNLPRVRYWETRKAFTGRWTSFMDFPCRSSRVSWNIHYMEGWDCMFKQSILIVFTYQTRVDELWYEINHMSHKTPEGKLSTRENSLSQATSL